jgi:membrane protease YdiL (CAAX protease family)
MSNEKNKEPFIKYCVYCGAKVDKEQIYCPKCGKLVVKIKVERDTTENMSKVKEELIPVREDQKRKTSRKCPGCGSIISSDILEQCPICNAKLEKVEKPKDQIGTQKSEKRTGFIFTNKKLVPEQRFVLDKAKWNLREGLSVFGNSIMVYIIIRILITSIVIFQLPIDGATEEINITTILLSQLPAIIFGVYPLWYIYSKKHDTKKLGFWYSPKGLLVTIAVGIIGGLLLILLSNFSSSIIELMIQLGINFDDIFSQIALEHQVIREAEPFWIILLLFLLNLSVLSTEIVYRGVLHNTLKSYFGNDVFGKFSTIVLVALIYSLLYLVFSLPFGIYFFLIEFFMFLILGLLYEINKNIYNPIIASIIYNSVLIIIVILP